MSGHHPTPAQLRRWRRHLADERAEATVYRDLAGRREGEEREILLALADAEDRHAAHWEELLGDEVGAPRRGDVRFRVLAWLARHFGWVFVLALAQRAEARATYDADADATPAMAADERIHAEVVRALATRGRNRLAGSFRAAVFGANDGLVSNLALVIGVAAAGATSSTVLLTGLAGLLAGALSMGAGEYISVRSQRELLAASNPAPEAATALTHLDVDANELALVYRARGMAPDEAQERADAVLADLTGPSREFTERHDDQHEAVGTDVGASLASFCFFASGAAIPVLPFLFGMTNGAALLVALLAVGAALLLTGAVVGVISGGPPVRRALRQLAIGAGAAGITHLLGTLFGATLG
ncbi:VIT1/CCC1 transporter family protein [Cellulomonas bogoriensis]|uniref:Membrane protein n=1 Tax=Cellulomonas bogoriensis 69B4 = DSM 16987 TaxID=1386082 RepID=A0A0A0BTB9_9CELL|nr:VIT1/CCC1 family protein [Cellulomonas bogoriensis]KGM11170.1 membrane protein [Cellulomonas bogoriensis 69B4 = DSM 16987]